MCSHNVRLVDQAIVSHAGEAVVVVNVEVHGGRFLMISLNTIHRIHGIVIRRQDGEVVHRRQSILQAVMPGHNRVCGNGSIGIDVDSFNEIRVDGGRG